MDAEIRKLSVGIIDFKASACSEWFLFFFFFLLSKDIVTNEEKLKSAEFSAKTFEDNTASDIAKKAQLEDEIIQLRGRSENAKQDIVAVRSGRLYRKV